MQISTIFLTIASISALVISLINLYIFPRFSGGVENLNNEFKDDLNLTLELHEKRILEVEDRTKTLFAEFYGIRDKVYNIERTSDG